MKQSYLRNMDQGYPGVLHGHNHSNYLHIAAASGAIGLAAFLLLLVAIARALLRAVRSAVAPPARAVALGGLAAFTGFLVEGIFEWNFGDAEVVALLYALVGLALAAPDWEEPDRASRG
jgi:O-antigen ligase